MIESQKEAALVKNRLEEVEGQTGAKHRLKSHFELDVVVKERRQKLAETNNEDAEFLEDACKVSGLRRSNSNLSMVVQDNQKE